MRKTSVYLIRARALVAIAVAVALAVTAFGVAAAATSTRKLPKNSVGAKQLKRSSVNGSKVADGSLTGADIAASTLGTVPSAVNADTLDGKHAADLLGPSSPSGPAGGALAGSYPSPTLNVSGGPCANGQALRNVSLTALLTCGPGIYFDASNNLAAVPGQWPNLDASVAGANTAFGDSALVADTDGFANSAFGAFALRDDTSGYGNSAFGQGAMKFNTTGFQNSAFGGEALSSNTTGHDNSAFGQTMSSNTTGNGNSALGVSALEQNTTGSNNVAIGQHAIWQNTTGSENVAIGSGAGAPLVTGSNNVYLASDNVGTAAESNTIRIGSPATQSAAFLAGVSGVTPGGTTAGVVVNGSGQLGVAVSSRRFKTDIHPIGSELPGLMRLRPVVFRYKRGFVHGANPRQFGLIAEQVARVYPNLVVHGRDGQPGAVAYQELPPLLLAQAQRQQARIDRQLGKIRALRAQNRRQQAQIDWLMRHARRALTALVPDLRFP